MAMTFPTNPSVNDEYTNGDRTWYWDGDSWVSKSVPEVVTPANVSSLTNDSAYLSTVDFGPDIINKPTTLDGYGISNAGGKGLTQSGSQIIINGQEIPGSRDLNTYRSTGIFPQNVNADAASGTNYPTPSAGILQVINDDYGNGLFTTQLYDQYSSNNYWARSYYNGTWTAWRNLAQDNDNYVDSLSWNSGTGVITVGRTGSLADLTVDINGRFVQQNTQEYLTNAAVTQDGNALTFTKGDGTTFDVFPIVKLSSTTHIDNDVLWNVAGKGLIWTANTDGAYIKFYNTGDADTDSRLEYGTTDNNNEYHRWMISSFERMNLKSAGLTVTGTITATGAITENSDERLKENIVTISNALETVSNLRGVNFTKDGHDSTGVIAQEVEAVMPQVVHTSNNEDGIKSVAYGNMVGVLIEAIKELKAEVDDLKSQLNK